MKNIDNDRGAIVTIVVDEIDWRRNNCNYYIVYYKRGCAATMREPIRGPVDNKRNASPFISSILTIALVSNWIGWLWSHANVIGTLWPLIIFQQIGWVEVTRRTAAISIICLMHSGTIDRQQNIGRTGNGTIQCLISNLRIYNCRYLFEKF